MMIRILYILLSKILLSRSLLAFTKLIMRKRLNSIEAFNSNNKRSCYKEPPFQTYLPFKPENFECSRARLLTNSTSNCILNQSGNCVVLWMQRDQRVNDNHAFQYAQSVALSSNIPLKVVFNLVPQFLEATIRQYGFMIKGLQEVERLLRDKGIPLHLLLGDPLVNIPQFVFNHNATVLVTDFSPLRVGLNWVKGVALKLDDLQKQSTSGTGIPLVQVDAHNIVPCWVASDKLEYAARTIRPKIQCKLSVYLPSIPPLPSNNYNANDNHSSTLDCDPINWDAALDSLQIDRTVLEVDWIVPGAEAAWQKLQNFIDNRLRDYSAKRNDPNEHVCSDLSPYLHFGQISAQRIVLHLMSLKKEQKYAANIDSFVEELVIRRELSDNFCFCKKKTF